MAAATPPPPGTLGGYVVGTKLGEGLQGRVFLGTHPTTGAHVALKCMDRARLARNPTHLKNLQRELAGMVKCAEHPNVIKALSVDENAVWTCADGSTEVCICAPPSATRASSAAVAAPPQDIVLIVLELATKSELLDYGMLT